ncbi:MAG TPA: hypothetical protein ENK60_01170, partial [Anaerolineae bacterium]|nr:hypothetical protein [Anaerolineae bacterium]
HRAGLKTIILPQRNEADLDDLPEDIRQELEFVLVEDIEQVLQTALRPAGGDQELDGAAEKAVEGPPAPEPSLN